MAQVSCVAVPSSHWTQAYVGLPYIMGVGECAHRAALVWRREFGFGIEPPPAYGDMKVAQHHIHAELAKPEWCRARRPMDGDAVVMWKGNRVCHVGVWVAPGHVLHCTRKDGMVLTPEGELEPQGFRVFGYFRWQEKLALAA